MVSLEIFGRRDFLSFYTCGEVCARGLGRSVIAWPTLAINGNHFGERPSPGPPLGHPLSTRESFKTITDRPAASFIREFAIQFRQLPRLPFAFNYSGTYARGTFITVICRLVSRTRRFCAIDRRAVSWSRNCTLEIDGKISGKFSERRLITHRPLSSSSTSWSMVTSSHWISPLSRSSFLVPFSVRVYRLFAAGCAWRIICTCDWFQLSGKRQSPVHATCPCIVYKVTA